MVVLYDFNKPKRFQKIFSVVRVIVSENGVLPYVSIEKKPKPKYCRICH